VCVRGGSNETRRVSEGRRREAASPERRHHDTSDHETTVVKIQFDSASLYSILSCAVLVKNS